MNRVVIYEIMAREFGKCVIAETCNVCLNKNRCGMIYENVERKLQCLQNIEAMFWLGK